MAKSVVTKKNMEKVIDELNKVLDADPAFDKGSEEDMKASILEASEMLEPADEVSSLCDKTIASLGGSHKKKEKVAGKKGKAPARKATGKKPGGNGKLSCFGQKLNSQVGAIDELVKDGKPHTLASIVKKSGAKEAGVVSHLKRLARDKGLKVTEKDGTFTVKK